MMKAIKLLLSCCLMLLLWPIILAEANIKVRANKAKAAAITSETEKNEYVDKILKNFWTIRFCFRMFHTDVETDAILNEYLDRRRKRN